MVPIECWCFVVDALLWKVQIYLFSGGGRKKLVILQESEWEDASQGMIISFLEDRLVESEKETGTSCS